MDKQLKEFFTYTPWQLVFFALIVIGKFYTITQKMPTEVFTSTGGFVLNAILIVLAVRYIIDGESLFPGFIFFLVLGDTFATFRMGIDTEWYISNFLVHTSLCSSLVIIAKSLKNSSITALKWFTFITIAVLAL